ncbi:hypothetical protein ASA1KI_20990 [Opitutales bacterium ASA1]|uniref:hypothetical protein n=1 Tax=Congregicoccus parvus TaxID=3081749 RepID=UPI002B2E35C9|nr:hypothetical protein ASA1KI_20990 [Opitutales bacterium ASA1]
MKDVAPLDPVAEREHDRLVALARTIGRIADRSAWFTELATLHLMVAYRGRDLLDLSARELLAIVDPDGLAAIPASLVTSSSRHMAASVSLESAETLAGEGNPGTLSPAPEAASA